MIEKQVTTTKPNPSVRVRPPTDATSTDGIVLAGNSLITITLPLDVWLLIYDWADRTENAGAVELIDRGIARVEAEVRSLLQAAQN